MGEPTTIITAGTPEASLRGRLQRFVDGPAAQRFVLTVIVVNGVTLGLETSERLMAAAGGLLVAIDRLCLAVFVLEIGLKLVAHGWRFFRNGWNLFDFAIVGISLLPATGGLSVLRAMRVLRVFRLVSVVPQMRQVIQALLAAIPGMFAIIAILALLFYVFGVMATKLFGHQFPEWFGTLGASLLSLFQVMTLDAWSDGLLRPMQEVYPYSWLFFVPFVLLTTFAVLNLFIAIIVNSMERLHDEERKREAEDDTQRLVTEIAAARSEIAELKSILTRR
jgi:voltage-gated sodium channel